MTPDYEYRNNLILRLRREEGWAQAKLAKFFGLSKTITNRALHNAANWDARTKERDKLTMVTLGTPVELLSISNATWNKLANNCIESVGRLVWMRPAELLKMKGIGPTTIADIENALSEYCCLL